MVLKSELERHEAAANELGNRPPCGVSLVIPTYDRHEVLVDTVRQVLELDPSADEVLIVDQSASHPAPVQKALAELAEAGRIAWLKQASPSIPAAMNEGLKRAKGEYVLFLDDDVIPVPDLVGRHRKALLETGSDLVAGQVLQPGEEPAPPTDRTFSFRSSVEQEIEEVMGGNFSVRRRFALSLGGFDENFVRVAYRFEAEFCERVQRASGRIRFVPEASVRHLRAAIGGTRSFGDHLRSVGPSHSVGEFYYLLVSSRQPGRWRRIAGRPLRAIATRHHLRRPWWVPMTLAGEISGLIWALVLLKSGQRLLQVEVEAQQ
jgi:GT2 family glycosyltransferase